jgi:hypothetical protein
MKGDKLAPPSTAPPAASANSDASDAGSPMHAPSMITTIAATKIAAKVINTFVLPDMIESSQSIYFFYYAI